MILRTATKLAWCAHQWGNMRREGLGQHNKSKGTARWIYSPGQIANNGEKKQKKKHEVIKYFFKHCPMYVDKDKKSKKRKELMLEVELKQTNVFPELV